MSNEGIFICIILMNCMHFLHPQNFSPKIPDLGDGDHDDAFSRVPYEKGFNLLYTLERMVGVERFAGFTKAYFNHFKFRTVTSQRFVEYFDHYFKFPSDKWFDWDTWLNQPGMPSTLTFDRTLSAECEGLADAWISVDDGETVKGMLPKNKLGAELFRNLYVFAGEEHTHGGQQPNALNINELN